MALDSPNPWSINCWSGPRCCSTSLMYAFAQRNDTSVRDEPLYAAYLAMTKAPRPYADLVMQAQSSHSNVVMKEQLLTRPQEGLLYVKHIAKQKVVVDSSVFQQGQHMLLVREPYAVLQSFSRVLQPTQHELCYTALLEIFSELRALGHKPIVVLSDELVAAPEPMLRTICTALNIPWDPAMLSWPAGPKPYDGVWAPWWYAGTHKSTGFSREVQERKEPLREELRPLLGECQALYRLMKRYALRPVSSAVPRSLPAPSSTDTSSAAVGSTQPAATAAATDTLKGADAVGASESTDGSHDRGTHVYVQDPRNADILIGMRDGVDGSVSMVWRPEARVSVLDSGYMLGDGVWEGIRLHRGVLMFIAEHLERLYEGAKALDMELGLSREELQRMLYDTVDANGMAQASGVHIRLMVTRGLKPTPYQSPYITIGKPTIIIIPEYKEAAPGPKEEGIRLFTCHVRRGASDVQDPMWNSHSKLNCIAACIQAKQAGVDEALMLDPHGFVATCNSVNFFIVRKGEVWAPTTKYQLHGITRANILQLCHTHGIPARELDFPLTQVYSADEAFVTGTFAGLIPVSCVDGRAIGTGRRGPLTQRLQQLYMQLMDSYAGRGRQVGL